MVPACSSDRFTLAIRPEKVSLRDKPGTETENCCPVVIKELLYVGSETHYRLEHKGVSLGDEMMNTKVGSQGFEIGQNAFAYLPPAALVVLDD